MTTRLARTAPQPRGTFFLGNIAAFRDDPLGTVTSAVRDHGDIVRFQLGPQTVHLLNHPDHVAHVLQAQRDNYDKATRSTRHIARVCGESLLTSNGAFWERQRRLIQPAFHHEQISGFAALMADSCESMLTRLAKENHSPSTERDLASEMTRLTYTVVARALFSTDVSDAASSIAPAMRVLLEETFTRLQHIFQVPGWIPTERNRAFYKSLDQLDRTVFEIIENHRRNPDRPNDLLSMLLDVRDPDSGTGLDDREIRDETVTFLIAGHETTSNALTWTFHLLSLHPDIQEELRHEVATVLSGRLPTLHDIPQLELTTRVIRESMRLYPPIWIIERHAREEDEIAGFRIPKNSAIAISPWTLHRHPDFWEAPEEFRPERFETTNHPAYLPFGAGPRFCIGSEFALLEARIILAMVLQRYRLRPVAGAVIEPFPGITLPPRHGLPLQLERISS